MKFDVEVVPIKGFLEVALKPSEKDNVCSKQAKRLELDLLYGCSMVLLQHLPILDEFQPRLRLNLHDGLRVKVYGVSMDFEGFGLAISGF